MKFIKYGDKTKKYADKTKISMLYHLTVNFKIRNYLILIIKNENNLIFLT